MKILAVDTASRSCSVALLDDQGLAAQLSYSRGRTHSRHLMGMIDSVLQLAALSCADLDGLAVSCGPGSFTGLRIGIGAVKGLAAARNLPAVGVSTLQALAYQAAGSPYLICPLIDARRGEVYCARYRWEDGLLSEVAGEAVAPPHQAADGIDERALFVGSGALRHRDLIAAALGNRAVFIPSHLQMVRAAAVGLLGAIRLQACEGSEAADIVPRYLRRSDAEIALEKRGATSR
jgi:tRNA threonylcarbamoyladenosine biosynthesis protein TsaB